MQPAAMIQNNATIDITQHRYLRACLHIAIKVLDMLIYITNSYKFQLLIWNKKPFVIIHIENNFKKIDILKY